jgi:hypothetical protein
MKRYIIFTLCVFLLFVFGCSSDVDLQDSEEIRTQTITDCIASGEWIGQCYYESYIQIAIETKDVTYCDKILENVQDAALLTERCYAKLAYVNSDPSLCAVSFDTVLSGPGCYTQLAILSNDDLICLEIDRLYSEKGWQDIDIHVGNCYQDYAAYYADASVCELIEYDRDPSPYYCYIAIAENHGDIQVCDNIENALKETCEQSADSSLGFSEEMQVYQELILF